MGMMSIRRFAKKMLAPVVIVLVVGLTVGMFYIGFPKSQVTSTAYQGPAAKIGGEKISDTKFNDYMMQANQQASQYAQYGLQYTSAQIRDTALQMAIRDYVIQQQIKQLKINVPDSEAEKLIKKYLPSEEELQSYMERQGLANRSAVVKQIVGQLKEQKLYVTNAKKSKIKVSKDEINGYMEEITVSHILVGTKDPSGKDLRSDEEALKRAEEAYQKAANKGDFAALVKEYSDDPGSKDKGGVYGPMPVSQFKGSMVKEFVDGALALKAGEISKPVKTQYGYHIIKLDKRSMPTGKDAKEKYAEIEEGLLVQKYTQSPAYSNWMKKQTTAAEAKLEILDPAIRAYRLAQKEKWAEAAKAYEKALTRKYYKGQWELRLDAAKAYTKSKQFDKAEKVLKGVPAANQDMYEYQVALATIQKENNQLSKAVATMTAYGRKHAQDASTHQQLQQLFTEWKATDAAAKEGEIVAKLKKQEEANLQKSQQNLSQKYGQTTEPAVTPEPSATPVASAAADKTEKSGEKATTEKKTKK